MVHAVFTVHGNKEYDTDEDNLTFSAGVGMMHQLTRLLGLRADLRYYHAFVDEHASHGGYFEDYNFWAVSVGSRSNSRRSAGPSCGQRGS